MNEAEEVLGVSIVSDDEAPEVVEPGEQALDLPSTLVAPELPPILMRRHLVIASTRNDRLDPALRKASPKGIVVKRTIADQSFRVCSRTTSLVCTGDPDRVERLVDEPNFRRGRRVQGD